MTETRGWILRNRRSREVLRTWEGAYCIHQTRKEARIYKQAHGLIDTDTVKVKVVTED